jgi:hypothetical protein
MNSVRIIYNLGSVVDWVEAIGTVGAVVVSLWLALSRRKEKLSIHWEYFNGSYYFWIANNSAFNVSIELVGIREYVPLLKKCWLKLTNQLAADVYNTDGSKELTFILLHPGETSKKYIYTEEKIENFCGKTRFGNYPVEILFDDGNGKAFKKKMYLSNHQK